MNKPRIDRSFDESESARQTKKKKKTAMNFRSIFPYTVYAIIVPASPFATLNQVHSILHKNKAKRFLFTKLLVMNSIFGQKWLKRGINLKPTLDTMY